MTIETRGSTGGDEQEGNNGKTQIVFHTVDGIAHKRFLEKVQDDYDPYETDVTERETSKHVLVVEGARENGGDVHIPIDKGHYDALQVDGVENVRKNEKVNKTRETDDLYSDGYIAGQWLKNGGLYEDFLESACPDGWSIGSYRSYNCLGSPSGGVVTIKSVYTKNCKFPKPLQHQEKDDILIEDSDRMPAFLVKVKYKGLTDEEEGTVNTFTAWLRDHLDNNPNVMRASIINCFTETKTVCPRI